MPKYLHINEKDRQIAENMLSDSIQLFQEEQLRKQIDEALDQGNKERFYELSELWKELQGRDEFRSGYTCTGMQKIAAIFQAQKEYIDTAIIPLTLIDGSSQGF